MVTSCSGVALVEASCGGNTSVCWWGGGWGPLAVLSLQLPSLHQMVRPHLSSQESPSMTASVILGAIMNLTDSQWSANSSLTGSVKWVAWAPHNRHPLTYSNLIRGISFFALTPSFRTMGQLSRHLVQPESIRASNMPWIPVFEAVRHIGKDRFTIEFFPPSSSLS